MTKCRTLQELPPHLEPRNDLLADFFGELTRIML
jgi:hypothetical protein